MKTAHVKTVDGTTIMIQESAAERLEEYLEVSKPIYDCFWWNENSERCVLFRKNIISVRFREV